VTGEKWGVEGEKKDWGERQKGEGTQNRATECPGTSKGGEKMKKSQTGARTGEEGSGQKGSKN